MTNAYVPATENVRYEVPGRQLGWRVNQLQQQGYPYQVQPAGGGVYIVIVQQPPAVDPFAYAAPRARSTRPPITPYVQVAAFVVILAAVGYIAYAVMGGASILPQSAAPDMRALFARTMDAIGGVLLLGVLLLIVWLVRPLVGDLASMARNAAGALGGLMRRSK
jgi:hypothetical protein